MTLTPLTDRFLLGFFGVRKFANNQIDDAFYDVANENRLSPQQKYESVNSLISLFKFCMILMIYAYSSYARDFREKWHNFTDDEIGLTRIIDNMIKKIK